MIFPPTLGVSFGENDESIFIPKSQQPPQIDGKWTSKTEWLDASETKIVDEKLTAYLRMKHDGIFVYVLIDFISDQGLERSGDFAVVCLDTLDNGGEVPSDDDYCFYRITKAGNFLNGIMQGNGMEWVVLQQSRVYDPYGTNESFKARIRYSHLNSPYDSVNSHVSYEFRIPIAGYGINEVMGFYVYANDGYSNNFLQWPADAGGKQYRTIVKDVLPFPDEWGSVHLKLDRESDLSRQVQLEEKMVEVRVQAKQIKDVIIIRLRNMDDSKADIYAFKILLDSSLKTFKGPKEWSKEGLVDNGATFSSLTRPIHAGDKEYFIITVDDVKPDIQWFVYGSDKNELAKGSVTPFHR
jgi:hypothetical protein